tara:strand:- start:37 stop:1035 length:999 start_codon:yes stop_codon:yes gene_type:complete
LHGTFGEDGSIQKILEANKMKYNGSRSKASEDCFDKIVANKLCRKNKIKTPSPSYQLMKDYDDYWNGNDIDFQTFIGTEGYYPIIVKPSKQGSSMGITILQNKPESYYERILEAYSGKFRGPAIPDYSFQLAVHNAVVCGLSQNEIIKIQEKYQPLLRAGVDLGLSVSRLGGSADEHILSEYIPSFFDEELKNSGKYNNAVIVEKYIPGKEITVSILGDKALPIIEIKPHSNVYDYKSKYSKGETEYICPAQLDKSLSKEIQHTALKVHKLLGCEVYSRVDFRLDENNNFYFLEINTLPGMTETSLFPMAAKAGGLSFEDLIDKIIKLSLEK